MSIYVSRVNMLRLISHAKIFQTSNIRTAYAAYVYYHINTNTQIYIIYIYIYYNMYNNIIHRYVIRYSNCTIKYLLINLNLN